MPKWDTGKMPTLWTVEDVRAVAAYLGEMRHELTLVAGMSKDPEVRVLATRLELLLRVAGVISSPGIMDLKTFVRAKLDAAIGHLGLKVVEK